MLCRQMLRHFHAGQPWWNSSNKLVLAKLRKKTGYTFVNCKKALELHGYNLEQAEKWLQDQAQALGWAKASKLEGRTTAQGLIGVAVDNKTAALVEVNCETDFVARNENFHKMVESAASACLNYAKHQNGGGTLSKINFSGEELKHLPGEGGKSLAEQLALVIGTVGENLALRRATCFLANDDTLLSGYAHPAPPVQSGILLGKFGALVAFKANMTDSPNMESPVEDVGRQLCQHIVGMNPLKIGIPEIDTANQVLDEEVCLIHQEFLLDPSQTVQQRIAEAGITVLDFIRFQCGEQFENPVEKSHVKFAAEAGV